MDGKSVAVGSRPVKTQSRVDLKEVKVRGNADRDVSGVFDQKLKLRGSTGWLVVNRGNDRAWQVGPGAGAQRFWHNDEPGSVFEHCFNPHRGNECRDARKDVVHAEDFSSGG